MPDTGTVLLIAAVFVAAGAVKGIVGLGLPTVVMGALGLAMPPAQAAALLVVPSLVTNLWQWLAGPAWRTVTRRLAAMLVFICLGTTLGIGLLTRSHSTWPSVLLGSVLVVYALTGLMLKPRPPRGLLERWVGPAVGGITGLLSGATGVFVMPAVPYLNALGMGKDELIQAMGLTFTVATVALALGLAWQGAFSLQLATTSTLAVAPALLGMVVGQRLRGRLDPVAFRKLFFVALLVVGLYMAVHGWPTAPTAGPLTTR